MTQMLNSGPGSTDNDSVDRKPRYKPYDEDVDVKKRASSASSEVTYSLPTPHPERKITFLNESNFIKKKKSLSNWGFLAQ